jgi:REP element-mobilizing transposase RayT
MTYDPKIHHRRSIRLKGYDYSQNGAYFITICAQDRKPLFGKIVNGDLQLNPFGVIARDEWLKTSIMRQNIEMDEFVIMPNHMHGIIVIDIEPRRDTLQRVPTNERAPENEGTGTMHRAPTVEQFGKPTSNTIPTIIRGYKGAVTKQINTLQINAGVYNIPERIWQKNYYEHVIRNETSLNKIREYIMSNPLNWKEDDYYLD